MDIIKSYKKNIVESKNFVFLSVLVSCLIRLGFYYVYDSPNTGNEVNGYLWIPELTRYLSSNIISFSLSILFTLGIIAYSSFLNTKHKLIRNRTYLIYVFTAFFFSCHPVFIYMNPQYIALLLLLICFDRLLDSYQQINVTGKSYSIGFLLAFASLFSFYVLMYLPLFWVGFKYMRCFNFKVFLTSLLGLITVYWIAFFYFLWQNDISTFLAPFQQLHLVPNTDIHEASLNKIIVFTICALLLATMAINYGSTSFYDKIQTRLSISFIFIISGFSFLAFVVNYAPILNLFVFVSSGCFLLSHFFTLTDQRWKVHLFYIFIFLYVIVCFYFLLNRVITTILAA